VLNTDDLRSLLVALSTLRCLSRDRRHALDLLDGAPVAIWLLLDAIEWTVEPKTKYDIQVNICNNKATRFDAVKLKFARRRFCVPDRRIFSMSNIFFSTHMFCCVCVC
jgi:hypothetical protein